MTTSDRMFVLAVVMSAVVILQDITPEYRIGGIGAIFVLFAVTLISGFREYKE